MIVCTRSLDAIARQALGKGNVAINAPDKIIEEFQIDPSTSQVTKEAFILADADLRNRKLKQKFLTNAATKHPDVRIIYVAKSGKSDIEAGNGIDAVLLKPKPEVLQQTVYKLIENVTAKNDVVSAADSVPVSVEPFKPVTLTKNSDVVTDEFGRPVLESAEVTEEELAKSVAEKIGEDDIKEVAQELPIQEIEPPKMDVVLDEKKESELISRIKSCDKVVDLAVLTRELSATILIKDIVKDNAQYVSIEDRLKAIREKVLSIYADPTIRSQEEKLDKIKALVYDKDKYMAAANTIIEQRVEDVISIIVDKTKECLDQRLHELDQAIVNLNTKPAGELSYTRVAGIMDERANLLLELQILDKEIRDIFTRTNDMAMGIASNIAEDNTNLSDSPLLNARLRLYGDSVVSDKSLDTIVNILTTADRTTEEFKSATRELIVMKNKLNKLIDLDREQITAMTQIIDYLRANNIEDNVIKENMLKKALRIYVAQEGSGRTVVPYVISKLTARTSNNVLYLDLTGTNKVADYGDALYTFDDWMQNRYKKDFCGVSGTAPTSTEGIQRLIAALVKEADYYKVINLVLTPEQKEVFELIGPDVLSINYIIEPKRTQLEFFKSFIKETQYANVGQRIVLNKCDIPLRPIIEELNVENDDNTQIVTIPNVPAIPECSLKGVRPYELASVVEAFGTLRKAVIPRR